MRANTRLDAESRRKLEWLAEACGETTTAVLKDAIAARYDQLRKARSAADILHATGFVGLGAADTDVSSDDKSLIGEDLSRKHHTR